MKVWVEHIKLDAAFRYLLEIAGLLFMHDRFWILLFLNRIFCHTSCLSEFTSIKVNIFFFHLRWQTRLNVYLREWQTRVPVLFRIIGLYDHCGNRHASLLFIERSPSCMCACITPSRPWFHNHIHFGHCCLLPTQLNIDVAAGLLHYSLWMFCKNH